MSAHIKAVVDGDIPAHRLLWLYTSEDGETMRIGLPARGGQPVDFVSTRDLKDGEEVTVSVRGRLIWEVETAEEVAPGDNVYADTDGRIVSHHSQYLHAVGYVLDAGQPGEIVRLVRNYKFKDTKMQEQDGQQEE